MLRRIGRVVLALAAVAGVVGGLLGVGVLTGRLQSLVVVSGSMRPTYDVGDVIISRPVPAASLDVGDVASLATADGVLVTHRVVAVEPAEGTAEPAVRSVTMKGDANPGNDAEPYVAAQALVPLVRVPRAGDVIAVLRHPAVGIPVIAMSCALVGYSLWPARGRAAHDAPDAGTTT